METWFTKVGGEELPSEGKLHCNSIQIHFSVWRGFKWWRPHTVLLATKHTQYTWLPCAGIIIVWKILHLFRTKRLQDIWKMLIKYFTDTKDNMKSAGCCVPLLSLHSREAWLKPTPHFNTSSPCCVPKAKSLSWLLPKNVCSDKKNPYKPSLHSSPVSVLYHQVDCHENHGSLRMEEQCHTLYESNDKNDVAAFHCN